MPSAPGLVGWLKMLTTHKNDFATLFPAPAQRTRRVS